VSINTHTAAPEWLDADALLEVITAAARAPSMHNSQPWRFRQRGQVIEVLADRSRQLSVSDPGGWAVRLSCGAALFNLRLALAARGTPAITRILPEPRDHDVLARLTPGPPRPATPEETRLYRAIQRRHSNRFPFAETPVPVAVRTRLIDAARAEAGWLDLLIGPAAIDMAAELARFADRVLAGDERYHAEMTSWARAGDAPDGVPVAAGGPAPRAFELLARRDFGTPDTSTVREYEREPLIGLIGVAGSAPVDDVHAGQVLQRVLLTATDLGLACSMLSQPIEVPEVREQLRVAVGRTGEPQMLLRFGYATPVAGTGRRPTTEVIDSAG
jgi:nitroreductase